MIINEESILLRLVQDMLISRSPVDTGNLKANGIVLKNNEILIGNKLVPYAFWTNEVWQNKRNPNARWVDVTVLQALKVFGSKYGWRVIVR